MNTGNGAGDVTFTSTVDGTAAGAQALTVTAGGGTVNMGVVGRTALASVSVTGGTITLDDAVTTSGAAGQSYTGTVELSTSSLSTGGNGLTFAGTLNLNADINIDNGAGAISAAIVEGTQSLTFKSLGTVTMDATGANNARTTLSLTGSTITIQNVTTSGTQDYSGAVVLGGGAGTKVLTTTDSGVTFTSTVNATTAGDEGLQLTTGTGSVDFQGAVGNMEGLASLTAGGSGRVTIQANVTTTGLQSYTGPVTLAGAADVKTFTTTDSNVTFLGSVEADTAGSQGLTVAAGTGTVDFQGAVGAANALESVDVTGNTILLANVNTSNAQDYTGGTTLNGTAYGTSNSNFTVTGATLLGASPTISTAGGNISLGTVDNAQALTADAAGGNVTLGVVGGNTSLTSLTVVGDTNTLVSVSTSGVQSYSGATLTNLNGIYTATVDGATVTVGGAANLSGATTINTVNGNVTLDDVDGGNTLSITAGTGNVATGNLGSGTALTGLTVVSATAVTTGTIDGSFALDITGTGAVQLGAVGGTTALSLATVTGATISLGDVTSTGNQTYTGATTLNGAYAVTGTGNVSFASSSAVTLGGDSSITTAGVNGQVSFTGTLDSTDGTQNLTINASGTVRFVNAVGGGVGTQLASLDVTTSGNVNINNNITTSGIQSYAGDVVLGGFGVTKILTTTNSNVTFTSTVEGSGLTGKSLVVAAGSGAVEFQGAVGPTIALTTLTVTGGSVSLQDVTTTDAQDYTGTLNGGAVTTGALAFGGVSTVTTNNGDVTLSTVNGGSTLTVAAGSGAVVLGAIGGSTALTGVTVTGATISLQDVATTGAQDYTGATTFNSTYTTGGGSFQVTGATVLAGNSSVTTSGGAVTFTDTVNATNGTETLTVDAGGGAVLFTGIVGGTTPATTLGGLSVTTSGTGTIAFNAALTATGTNSITTAGGNITFSSTVDGGQGLTVNAGSGVTQFAGAVGGTAELTSLTVSGSGAITLQSDVTTTAAQSYTGAVTLAGGAGVKTLTTTNAAVTFSSTVEAETAASQGLTVAAGGGLVDFQARSVRRTRC